jgi:ER membrane protein complex subunit 3
MSSVHDSSFNDITLDKSILLWVLLPITFVMFLQGLLRQYISVLLRDEKQIGTTLALSAAKDQLDNASKQSILHRARRIRYNSNFLPSYSIAMRRKHIIQKSILEAIPSQNTAADGTAAAGQQQQAAAQDPTAMMGMMKQNMSMIIPNMVLMGWVSYFFSGFVIVKLPVLLTDRFKQMLQRGIVLQNLNVSYVSSVSWYLLNLFGMRGLFTLILGEGSSAVDSPDMQMMQAQGGQPGQPVDYPKVFQQEKNELDIMP